MSNSGRLGAVKFDLANPLHWHQVAHHTKPYGFQLEALLGLEALIDGALHNAIPKGTRGVLIASRQSGKNEINARLEARMLTKYSASRREIVKAAPSYRQVKISMDRLKMALANPLWTEQKNLVRWEEGYICNIGRSREYFLSCEPQAHRVGHTASLYLSLDESQDIDPDTYLRDLRPMLLQTGAFTIAAGTAWAKDSLIEQEREIAREKQRRLGVRLLYEYPWWRVAEDNQAYGEAAEEEIATLGGEDHPIVQTQYLLKPVDKVGSFLTASQLRKLEGSHPRQAHPTPGRTYIAGVDWCGSDEADEAEQIRNPNLNSKRDSTVVTIGELVWQFTKSGNKVPIVRVVDHLFMTAKQPFDMLQEVYEYVFDKWQCIHVVSDGSGVGDMPSNALSVRRPSQVTVLRSSLSVVTQLGFNLIGAISSGRFTMYRDDSSVHRECMLQFRECRKEFRSNGQMRFGAPETKIIVNGVNSAIHDDFCKSAAYCLDAAVRLSHLALDYDPMRTVKPADDSDDYYSIT